MMEDISEVLGCTYPIIQGAMGYISHPKLVAAVSESGGFGLLATALIAKKADLVSQIMQVRELTDKPFGANLMAMNPYSEEYARVLIDNGVRAVTISGGLPVPIISFLKEHGVTVLVVVATVSNARKAVVAGADIVIAEGSESGGVQGLSGISTIVLVPLVVDAVSVPVVAAGGIGDARGYRAAFSLGAKGVQVGTRFIASTESIVHEKCKKALCDAHETDVLLLRGDRISIRVLKTPFVDRISSQPGDAAYSAMSGDTEGAWLTGDLDAGALPIGQIVGMIKEVKSVKEIIMEMVE